MKEEKSVNSDFSKLLEGFDNKWVILLEDSKKVIASSENLDDIADKLSEGVLLKVPDSNSSVF